MATLSLTPVAPGTITLTVSGGGGTIPLSQAGQTPSQNPVTPGTVNVGSLAVAARADHVHPSAGLYWIWGTGADGDLVFDGTTTVTLTTPFGNHNLVPSGSKYTIDVPIVARNLTISNGVTLNTAQGSIIYASGLLSCPSGTCVIHADGNAGGATGAAGAALAAAGFGATGAGGAGGTGIGNPGFKPAGASDQWGTSSAGNGGLGSGGAGGSGATSALSSRNGGFYLGRDPLTLTRGLMQGSDFSSGGGIGSLAGGNGGGSGGGDSTNNGGGGGSGGGILIVNARLLSGNITIRAAGGAGGSTAVGNTGGGGGGSGGYCFVNTTDATAFTGTVTAPGGAAGGKTGTGVAGQAGGAGNAFLTTWA